MSDECRKCALAGTSCCQGTQIVLTTGDLSRISSFLGDDGFHTVEPPDLQYLDPGYDPEWLSLTLRPDGRRLVLKRTPDLRCCFLKENGCLLPPDRRPLICRLHPYAYTRAGILGIDETCPLANDPGWPFLLEGMGMPTSAAREWHRLLYAELQADRDRDLPPLRPPRPAAPCGPVRVCA